MLLAAVSFSAVVTSMTPGFGSEDTIEEFPRTVGISAYKPHHHMLMGGLLADAAACEANEKVKVLEEDPAAPGGFSVVGRTRTDRQGRWDLSYRAHEGDRLQVDVPQSFARTRDCAATGSKTYEVE